MLASCIGPMILALGIYITWCSKPQEHFGCGNFREFDMSEVALTVALQVSSLSIIIIISFYYKQHLVDKKGD